MYVSRVATLAGLAALRPGWNALADGSPFVRWEWLEAWWRHFGVRDAQRPSGNELLTLAIYDDRRVLRGVAPWYLSDVWGQGRVIRGLGTGEVCSEYLTVLAAPEWQSPVLDVLTTWLCGKTLRGGARPLGDPVPRWDALVLESIDADDLCVNELAERMTWFGCDLERRKGPPCWRLALPGSWSEYLATLSKSHRKQVRRVERRLLDTGRAQWHTVSQLADLSEGFENLVALHQQRWNRRNLPGCFSSSQFAAFHRDVTRRMLAEGILRLHWLELDDRPVASEYALGCGDVLYAYQSGIDPDVLSQEPGRVAAVAMIQAAIREGYHAIDFLRGDEPYKAHWRAQPRPTLELRISAPTLTARARHRLWLAAAGLKRWTQARRDEAVAMGPGRPAIVPSHPPDCELTDTDLSGAGAGTLDHPEPCLAGVGPDELDGN